MSFGLRRTRQHITGGAGGASSSHPNAVLVIFSKTWGYLFAVHTEGRPIDMYGGVRLGADTADRSLVC